MGVCREIWQQKDSPNMLEFCVDGVGGWRVDKKKMWAWCDKEGKETEGKLWRSGWNDWMLRRKLPDGGMSEVAELFLGWSHGGSIALYTPKYGAQEEPFDHPAWLCVCTLGLHTFTLVLNTVTRVWLSCDQGTFKTRLCDLLRNRHQSRAVREVNLVIPGVGIDPVFARQNVNVQVEQNHLNSCRISLLAPGVPSPPNGPERDLHSVEWLRFILCLEGDHCLVFVFICQIAKLWVMCTSGGVRSKHCPVCRSAVCVHVQTVWNIAEGGWEKSRLYHHSYQT